MRLACSNKEVLLNKWSCHSTFSTPQHYSVSEKPCIPIRIFTTKKLFHHSTKFWMKIGNIWQHMEPGGSVGDPEDIDKNSSHLLGGHEVARVDPEHPVAPGLQLSEQLSCQQKLLQLARASQAVKKPSVKKYMDYSDLSSVLIREGWSDNSQLFV